MRSSTLTAITIIIAIIGFVGGMVLAVKLVNDYGGFSLALMIEVWIGVALYCIPLAGISSVLENQKTISNNQRIINEKIVEILESNNWSKNESEDNATSDKYV